MNRSDMGRLLVGRSRKSKGKSVATELSLGASSAVKQGKSPGDSLGRGATLAAKRGRASEELANGAALAVRRKSGGYIDKQGYIVNDTTNNSLRRARATKRNDELSGLRLKEGGHLWIQNALNPHHELHPNSKGALHRHLNIPQGQKIPLSKLHKAEHSKSPKIRKEANLAETLKGFHHRPTGR